MGLDRERKCTDVANGLNRVFITGLCFGEIKTWQKCTPGSEVLLRWLIVRKNLKLHFYQWGIVGAESNTVILRYVSLSDVFERKTIDLMQKFYFF